MQKRCNKESKSEMRIGYPCINLSIGCKGDRSFRLKSYSTKRLVETVYNNLNCLQKILEFNSNQGILFFRITSDLVPFASHPICKFNWQKHFRNYFEDIGLYIKKRQIRISMHPDQFVLINSLDQKIFRRSLKELFYHADILDLLGLDTSAKIQMHVGGVYGDKDKSTIRFVSRLQKLEENLKGHLVIENDIRYNLNDCIKIHKMTGIPVLFDSLHHEINNSGGNLSESFGFFTRTWKNEDGLPMVDYSSQQKQKNKGKHAETLDLKHFRNFLQITLPFDYDLMLEIKDKEQSALKAIEIARQIGIENLLS